MCMAMHGSQELLVNNLQLTDAMYRSLLSCLWYLLCRYVHGGQELLFNSLYVPYYRAGQFTGAAIGARHNLEVSDSWIVL